MSLNSRKDEDILNDLHSAQGRLNSSEIIDLETEIKKTDKKKQMDNTEESKTDLENEIKIQGLKEQIQTQKGTTTIEEVQKNLFAVINTADQNDERQERFKDFLEFREIKEEDYPIIAELYTYPNDKFIRSFHNAFNFEKERSGKMIVSMIEEYKDDPKSRRFLSYSCRFLKNMIGLPRII